MQKLAQTERTAQAVFVTMTMPDEYHPHNTDATHNRGVFRKFEKRFIRAFPDGGFVWRKEYKDRLSGKHVGELFPHYHLVVWGVPLGDLRKWCARAWWESCGRLSLDHLEAGTRVEQCRTWRGTLWYISKYISKTCGGTDFDTGRVWGFVAIDNLPFVQALVSRLSEREAIKLIRYMRRFARLRGRDYHSLTIFCDASAWQNLIEKEFRILERLTMELTT